MAMFALKLNSLNRDVIPSVIEGFDNTFNILMY